MRGQIAVVQQLHPCLLIVYHAKGKRLLDNLFRAVDVGIALVKQVFPHGLPCQFRAELKPLNGSIPHRIKRELLVIVQRFPQPGHRSGKAVIFFMQLVHQFNTIPFDVRKKYRLHAVLNVHNVKFQQRGQFLAVHPELRPVVLWHPIHG